VVDAFLDAARGGDLDALVALLDPDVALRADTRVGDAAVAREFRGARAVGEQAFAFASRVGYARPAVVNGVAGIVAIAPGRPIAVIAFVVAGGRIVELDILADPVRLRRLDLTIFDLSG
jgi:RNA polymerase sigma-70 factor (ECF subfamily)